MAQGQNNNPAIWDEEYLRIQAIPSSKRVEPSKALRLGLSLLDIRSIRKALDAGCGNGRNAVFLAEQGCLVEAVDFAPAALQLTTDLAEQFRVKSLVSTKHTNFQGPLPYSDETFDLCLDSYVSCHFTDPQQFAHYWAELSRVTRPGGHIFTSMFSIDDEYYSDLATTTKSGRVVEDPANQVRKRLYDEAEFKSFFSAGFSRNFFIKFQFSDLVFGREYRRSLLVMLMEK